MRNFSVRPGELESKQLTSKLDKNKNNSKISQNKMTVAAHN